MHCVDIHTHTKFAASEHQQNKTTMAFLKRTPTYYTPTGCDSAEMIYDFFGFGVLIMGADTHLYAADGGGVEARSITTVDRNPASLYVCLYVLYYQNSCASAIQDLYIYIYEVMQGFYHQQ